MALPNYDNWKLHDGIGIKKAICECMYCEREISKGEEVLDTSEGIYCDKECFMEDMMEQMNARQKYAGE